MTTGRISKEKTLSPPENPGPRSTPVDVAAEWLDAYGFEDGWCSLCHARISEGVHVYKTVDLRAHGSFSYEIPHHVICESCVNVLTTAAKKASES